MDKILFPYRGYPAFPPRSVIYPEKKSSLENLLDHFFFNLEREEGLARFPAPDFQLGSGLIAQSQKATAAAMQIAEK
jgi:hypothetical protein